MGLRSQQRDTIFGPRRIEAIRAEKSQFKRDLQAPIETPLGTGASQDDRHHAVRIRTGMYSDKVDEILGLQGSAFDPLNTRVPVGPAIRVLTLASYV